LRLGIDDPPDCLQDAELCFYPIPPERLIIKPIKLAKEPRVLPLWKGVYRERAWAFRKDTGCVPAM
jgi:hypothetical protein